MKFSIKIKHKKSNEELSSLLNIILEKYPEIKEKDFYIDYEPLDDAYATSGKFFDKLVIVIDSDMKKMDNEIKTGIIVSELSHLVRDLDKKKIMYIWELIKYNLSKKYRLKDERDVDLKTIERGFGKELLKLIEYDDKDAEDNQENEGLSAKEIIELMQKPTLK